MSKRVVASLDKCYALAKLSYKGEPCFLAAAEKQGPCLLFRQDGALLETVWTQPGGVMTMVPVPGGDGTFLATHKFYSPNDSKEAKIVIAMPKKTGGWTVSTLVDAPFVHRFGILQRGGVRYLLVCCLKSGHSGKDDWSMPGKVLAARLPTDLSGFDEGNQLPLEELKTGLLKNHGFCTLLFDGVESALVTCEQGVFLFSPPEGPGKAWGTRQLLAQPVSDAVLCDFDGDGQLELGCISPFHGDCLSIYHLDGQGAYQKIWQYPKPCEMLHATWAGMLCSKPTWVVGHRKGERSTLAVTWEAGFYTAQVLDTGAGAANVIHLVNADGCDVIVAANREINEVAMYTLGE